MKPPSIYQHSTPKGISKKLALSGLFHRSTRNSGPHCGDTLRNQSFLFAQILIRVMRGRDRQAKFRLDKISETSSPSPKREQKPDELSNGRVNPLSLTTAVATPKTSVSRMEEPRQAQMSRLQEQIMDRKRRLDLWQQAESKRSECGQNPRRLLATIARGIAAISEQSETKHSLLLAIRKGKRAVLRWLLIWLRQLFNCIKTNLALQRNAFR